MTADSLPQDRHTHCSGVQGTIFSTRGIPAGNSCRPGCLHLSRFLDVAGDAGGKGSRRLSASTSAALTPGSSSSNVNCSSCSFSLFGPYLPIRYRRRRSCSTCIINSARCNSLVRCPICAASLRGGMESVERTIGYFQDSRFARRIKHFRRFLSYLLLPVS